MPDLELALMDAPLFAHPTDPILYAYGLGKLDEAAAVRVESHLEGCGTCRQRVSELSGDSFVGRVRDAGGGREASSRPAAASRPGASQSAGPKTPAPDPGLAQTLPPELVDNPKYLILAELGRGGMGIVYKVFNKKLKRYEALKVLNPEMLACKGAHERFRREMEAAAQLNHPNIVTVYAQEEFGRLLTFAMEYIDGCDLATYVKAHGPLPWVQACKVIHQAAQGLQHASEQGLVHRDIKPANLMLGRLGRHAIKLLDFGLAKAASENPFDGSLTRDGQMLGTVDYQAPEQAMDARSADVRADIYSLGCTHYYLLSGGPPFDGTSCARILEAHRLTEPRPLNLVRPEVPRELAAVVAKMMAKDPPRRYQTPEEVAEALKPFLKPLRGAVRDPDTQAAPDQASAVATELTPSGPNAAAPQEAARSPSRPEGSWEGLIAIAEPEGLREAKPKSAVSGLGRAWPPTMKQALAAGAVILPIVIAAVALVIITRNGKLVLEGVPERAEVLIDGKKVTVRWPEGGGAVNVTVRTGRHGVLVKKDGFRAFGKEVSVETGGPTRLQVRLVPLVVPPPAPIPVREPSAWPAALSLTGQTLPVKGRLLAMSRDGRRVFMHSEPPEFLWVVEAPDGSKVIEMKGQPRNEGKTPGIWGAEFSPDGKSIAVGLHGHQVRTWETATGEQACVTSLFPGWSIAYGHDGQRLAVNGRQTKHVFVGDSATGRQLAELGPHTAVTRSVAFSPDGEWLASGSGAYPGDEWERQFGTGHDLKLWNLESGTGFDLEGHSMYVTSVAFSPDGKRLASASGDKTAKIWDVATKKCLVTFEKHQSAVRAVRFSPDGRLIASIANEYPVRVWDSATGREIAVLAGLRGDPEFLQFSPKGRWIYSGAQSTLKAWVISTGAGHEEFPGTVDSTNSSNPAAPRPMPVEPAPARVDQPRSIENSIGMKLVLIREGDFPMGSPDWDKNAEDDEKPQHAVRITRPFYLGATEVTVGQFRRVAEPMGLRTEAETDGKGGKVQNEATKNFDQDPKYTWRNPGFAQTDEHPVVDVSWNDAIAFCNKLSELEKLKPYYESGTGTPRGGGGYRLPTEAEWEYACRAGTMGRFHFGDGESAVGEYAWFVGNSGRTTHPVGQKRPNAWHLFDMLGNAREWCWDAYDAKFYTNSPGADPLGPSEGTARVCRGASWVNGHWRFRSVDRYSSAPGDRNNVMGFRVARSPSAN
jgi:formylglycine-generating enzyme required for sulfatase activity/serine/threonine protein kinase